MEEKELKDKLAEYKESLTDKTHSTDWSAIPACRC